MLFCVSASHKNANLPLLEALNIKNEAAFVDALRTEGSDRRMPTVANLPSR